MGCRCRISLLMLQTLVIAASTAPPVAVAQPADSVIRYVVHPADVPDPALKYQLLPPLTDRRPENAAVWYGKVTAEQQAFFGAHDIWTSISDWASLSLDDVRKNERLQQATDDSPIFDNLERAARSEYCDWQLPLRDEAYYQMLLPELQQSRSFARLLAVRVRRQVADGDFEGAIRTLQSGYALARHAADGATMVHGLVAFSQSSLMSQQLDDLVQQPEAPNLYWALTSLPDPLVEVRPAIEGELAAFELTFPSMQDLTSSDYDDAYWKHQLETMWEALGRYTEVPDTAGTLFWLTVRGYPLAKQGLIAEGWTPQRVEAMPVAQVVLVHSVLRYQRLRDERMKWLFVPYPAKHAPAADDTASSGEEVLPLSALLPPIQSFRYSAANAQRQIAVLRLVEAIRLYGARHDGRLPPSLEAISDLPIPIDPINGEPFGYRVEADTAVIEGAPLQWHRSELPPQRWEVRFAAPQSP